MVHNTENTKGLVKLIELPLCDEHIFVKQEMVRWNPSYLILISRFGYSMRKKSGRTDIIRASCWTFIKRIGLTSFGVDYKEFLSFVCNVDQEEMLFLNEDFMVGSFKQYEQPLLLKMKNLILFERRVSITWKASSSQVLD